ncbi:hypothetical protein AB0J38_07785 [Streptomyces sp. NPDC050095]|uniref:hypothetical protein n=1 Tax=unclassified Streptomyces TaxID=2593676 RepID=UPI00342617ED
MANTPENKEKTSGATTTGPARSATAKAAQKTAAKTESAGTQGARAVTDVGDTLVEAQGRAVSAARRATSAVTTAWALLSRRGLIAGSAAAGAVAVAATSFVAGRRVERRGHGPLTRLTGGRV